MKRLCRLGALSLALLASACSAVPIVPPAIPNSLEPHGPAAMRINQLWWVMFWPGAVIWLLVVVLLFAALLRRRRASSATIADSSGGDTGRRWPIWGGIVLPVVVLALVFGDSILTLAAIENPAGEKPVKLEIIGRRWWWQVKYPDDDFETANEVHVPVGTPVQIRLESGDVIHSFWVPELHGKMDLVPTRINEITIQADQAGLYRGQCAEFCGLQHAHMGLLVLAQNDADYHNWVSGQKQPAQNPADQAARQGQQVFMSQGCVFCHTVRGLDDKSIDRSGVDLGPDLTHLSGRMTIAGASLTLNTGNLAGWVIDPQHVKPGNLMPNQAIASQDLQSLLAYLATLK